MQKKRCLLIGREPDFLYFVICVIAIQRLHKELHKRRFSTTFIVFLKSPEYSFFRGCCVFGEWESSFLFLWPILNGGGYIYNNSMLEPTHFLGHFIWLINLLATNAYILSVLLRCSTCRALPQALRVLYLFFSYTYFPIYFSPTNNMDQNMS